MAVDVVWSSANHIVLTTRIRKSSKNVNKTQWSDDILPAMLSNSHFVIEVVKFNFPSHSFPLLTDHRNHYWPMCWTSTMIFDTIVDHLLQEVHCHTIHIILELFIGNENDANDVFLCFSFLFFSLFVSAK